MRETSLGISWLFLSTSPEMPTLEQNFLPELAWPPPSLLPPGDLEDQEVTGAHHRSFPPHVLMTVDPQEDGPLSPSLCPQLHPSPGP